MSLAERKLNHEIREKILTLDPTDIRVINHRHMHSTTKGILLRISYLSFD